MKIIRIVLAFLISTIWMPLVQPVTYKVVFLSQGYIERAKQRYEEGCFNSYAPTLNQVKLDLEKKLRHLINITVSFFCGDINCDKDNILHVCKPDNSMFIVSNTLEEITIDRD